MKTPLPYRWNAQDPFLRTLTLEQDGCYRRLMDSCWLNHGLPMELDHLGVICGIYDQLSKFVGHIWPKLKDRFYLDSYGKYQHPELDLERTRLTKLSKDQSKRAKKRKYDNLTASPRLSSGKPNRIEKTQVDTVEIIPVIPMVSDGMPTADNKCYVNKPDEPTANPEEDQLLQCNEPESPRQADGINKETVSHETLDQYFDSESAWRKFVDVWPRHYFGNNRLVMDRFLKIVINEFWAKRIMRAAKKYQEWLQDNGYQDLDLVHWFSEWQAWEE